MRIRHLVGALVLFGVPTSSQVTGVPGINDLTVLGIGSGSISCLAIGPPPPFTPIRLTLSAAPRVHVFLSLHFRFGRAVGLVQPCAPVFVPFFPQYLTTSQLLLAEFPEHAARHATRACGAARMPCRCW